MTIVAKFPGKCLVCGTSVAAGERVEWTKGEGVKHERCANGKPVKEAPKAESGFAPTTEQAHALDLFGTGDSLAVEAGAGTGKTSTLLLLAKSAPKRRGQYIAFNKAIVTEAQAKMPATVNAATAHSLAYKAWGNRFSHRLRGAKRMKSIEIANRLGLDPINVPALDGKGSKQLSRTFLGGHVLAAVIRFCQSADLEPDVRHFPYIEGIDPITDGVKSYSANNMVARALLPAMQAAWADFMNVDGSLPYRHDHYLKAWQLSDPKINVDYILFDEAQDANPVMTAIVSAQQEHAQLVWVGDSQQQIYSFTGAVNALAKVPADQRAFLTQSFRFGPEVARVANEILGWLNAELRLVGTDTIPSTVEQIDDPDAILTRTNAAAVSTVLRGQRANKRVALVGGGQEVVAFAKAANDLMDNGHTEFPDLACFESWGEVQAYVTEDQLGSELQLMVKLVDEFGVPTILEALENPVREQDADVIVSTAHKAKGREWDAVQLAGDFPTENAQDEELRLLYVACTRAKRVLDIESVALLGDVERSQ